MINKNFGDQYSLKQNRKKCRIDECLERYPLGQEIVQKLIALHADNSSFNPAVIAAQGWVAIDAPLLGG